MRPAFLAAALAGIPAVASGQAADTLTYADRHTEALVAQARGRHVRQDSLLQAYRALVTTRVDVSAGRSRFARQFPLLAHETTARLHWRRPNDLRIEVLGVRRTSAFRDVQARVGYDRPWFVPRALGDSIRLMGIPEAAALHPLAPGAERYYRYAVVDSVLVALPGRTIRAVGIRVTPRELAPAMVAGDVWVDAETADVVRLMVRFLGEYLWDPPDEDATPEDSARARRDTRWAQRFLTVDADLEYSLVENRFWMPYRQMLAVTAEIDLLIRGAIPVRAVTSFRDYTINTGGPLALEALEPVLDDTGSGERARTLCREPGVAKCDRTSRDQWGYARRGAWTAGSWEITVPPLDSLERFGWAAPLTLDLDAGEAERIRRAIADLGRLAEGLPDEWLGRRAWGLDLAELGRVARFNRVQGMSLGLGVVLRPGVPFTTLHLDGRLGLADLRPTGGLTWRRDGPSGLLEIRAHRRLVEVEPWTNGLGLGNSLNALFAGHDDADYYLVTGGGLRFTPYGGPLADIELAVGVEAHRGVTTEAGSALNDWLGGSGVLPPNPDIAAGTFVRAAVRPTRRVGASRVRLGVEALVGDSVTGGRAWAHATIPFRVTGRSGALTLKTGYAVGDSLPQLRFRVGGPATVRGYDYGTRVGQGIWAAQLDLALTRGWIVAPVVFADVGDTYDADQFDPLVGVGGGLSFFGGWLRFNGAVGLNPSGDFRFDLLFGAPR